MNRGKFASLPQAAQSIIRNFGGAWLSDHAARQLDALDRDVLDAMQSDPRRTVTFPDAADARAIHAVYEAVTKEYAGSSDHDRALLASVRTELAKLRTGE